MQNSLYTLTTIKKLCIIKLQPLYREVAKVVNEMTGKEIVNLIDMLHELNISDEKIINIIRYIETHEPRENEPRFNDNKE